MSRHCGYEDLISAYLDGEMAKDAVSSFERHLAGCRHCSTACDQLRADASALRQALPEIQPPAHIKTQLFQRIDAGSEAGRNGALLPAIRELFSFKPRAWAYASAPVVVLAIIISVIHVQNRIEDGKILAAIDRSRAQWAGRDTSINPFNINPDGSPARLQGKNPFEAYLKAE